MALWQDLPDGIDFTPSPKNFGEAAACIRVGNRQRERDAKPARFATKQSDRRSSC